MFQQKEMCFLSPFDIRYWFRLCFKSDAIFHFNALKEHTRW